MAVSGLKQKGTRGARKIGYFWKLECSGGQGSNVIYQSTQGKFKEGHPGQRGIQRIRTVKDYSPPDTPASTRLQDPESNSGHTEGQQWQPAPGWVWKLERTQHLGFESSMNCTMGSADSPQGEVLCESVKKQWPVATPKNKQTKKDKTNKKPQTNFLGTNSRSCHTDPMCPEGLPPTSSYVILSLNLNLSPT